VDEAERRAAAIAAVQNVADPAVRQRIWDEGFAEGYAQGHAAAAAEARQRLADYIDGEGAEAAQRLNSLLDAAEQGVQQVQQRMADAVLQIACTLARQVLRTEIETRPEALVPVVQEALDMLATDARPATVRIHPDTLHGLRGALESAAAGRPVQWVADAAVGVAGCRVESAGASVDGTLQTRWLRAVSRLGVDLPPGSVEPLE
jgi:flagellar assembly protein FliH